MNKIYTLIKLISSAQNFNIFVPTINYNLTYLKFFPRTKFNSQFPSSLLNKLITTWLDSTSLINDREKKRTRNPCTYSRFKFIPVRTLFVSLHVCPHVSSTLTKIHFPPDVPQDEVAKEPSSAHGKINAVGSNPGSILSHIHPAN